MIVYSRSAAGWFIILIFHGRIMFITIGKKKCCPVSILNLFFEIQSHVYMVYVLYSFSVYLQEPFCYEQGGCCSGLLMETSEPEPYISDATDGYQFWNQASLILQASLGFCRWLSHSSHD